MEAYFPRENRNQLPDIADRARAAAEAMRLDGVDVDYLYHLFVPEDEICFHVFVGPSAEAIGELSRRAPLQYDRILEVGQ